jgi:hypothetical protein
MATNSTLVGPTMTLRSGRKISKWHIAQARLRHNNSAIGDSIKFSFTDPPDPRLNPMSSVFNTPELLEQILLNLSSGFHPQGGPASLLRFQTVDRQLPLFQQAKGLCVPDRL